MLYTAQNLTTDEIFASNSFKTVYEAVMANLTSSAAPPSIAETWSIKRRKNLNANNFSFTDVVFSGDEIYTILLRTHEIIVYRVYDKTIHTFRARYFNSRL